MPYIFPRRRLRDQDVLDPIDLNEDISPSADLYSGRLDEHNFEPTPEFSAELRTDVAVTPDSTYSDPIVSNSYYNVYYVKQHSDPQWGTAGNYKNPKDPAAVGGPPNAWVLKNVPTWQPVTFGSNKSGTIKVFTGNSKLWVVACFQYIWYGFTEFGGHNYSYPPNWDGTTTNEGKWGRYPCMVQFALRVDGVIIESTKTGFRDHTGKVVRPFKMTKEKIPGTTLNTIIGASGTPVNMNLPGPAQDGEPNCGALSPESHNIRLGSWVNVSSGTHVVEIVARRLDVSPYMSVVGDGAKDEDKEADQVSYQPSNRIALNNRQLLVVDYPILPPASSGSVSVEASAFNAEDVVSQSSIGANRVDKVRSSFNAIKRGAVDRGAFNYRHLSSKVAFAGSSMVFPSTAQGSSSFTNPYPGYGSNTVSSSGSIRSPGSWYGPMQSASASQDLQVDIPNYGSLRTFDKKSVIILLGNVAAHKLNKSYAGGSPVRGAWSSCNTFAAFCIFATEVGSSASQLRLSEGVINRDTNVLSDIQPQDMSAGQVDPVAHDVPLLQVIRVGGAATDSNGNSMSGDNSHFAKGTSFENFFIAGSVMAPAESGAAMPSTGTLTSYADCTWWQGNLSALVLEE